MRPLATSVLFAFAGCQCLVPVDEFPPTLDAGSDAGCQRGEDCPQGYGCANGVPHASIAACTNGVCGFLNAACPTDAGPPRDAGQCATASQCSGARASVNWCTGSDAGFSCVENTCVWECPSTGAGRTCSVSRDAGCITCGSRIACMSSCTSTQTYTAQVEPGAACTHWPGTTIPFTQLSFTRSASRCCYAVTQTGGSQTLGELCRLNDGQYLADFPALGGWCTGRSAVTGVARGIISCPACQFVVQGFE